MPGLTSPTCQTRAKTARGESRLLLLSSPWATPPTTTATCRFAFRSGTDAQSGTTRRSGNSPRTQTSGEPLSGDTVLTPMPQSPALGEENPSLNPVQLPVR